MMLSYLFSSKAIESFLLELSFLGSWKCESLFTLLSNFHFFWSGRSKKLKLAMNCYIFDVYINFCFLTDTRLEEGILFYTHDLVRVGPLWTKLMLRILINMEIWTLKSKRTMTIFYKVWQWRRAGKK